MAVFILNFQGPQDEDEFAYYCENGGSNLNIWIAENQMMHETEKLVLMNLDFLPLKTNAHIVEGNALQLDWNRIVSRNELSYIIGIINSLYSMSTLSSLQMDMRMVG